MGPLLGEAAARLRAEWLAQSWPTSLCTIRSMSGWYGTTLGSRGVGMQMMDWCTVVTSKRHRRFSLSFKLVYCRDGKRKGRYPNVKFDFLGFCFRPRLVQNFRDKTLFGSFNPAVSPSAMKAMREAIRDLKLWHQTQLTLQDIARELNPLLRGWTEYYGRYARSGLYPLFRYINLKLRTWVMRKFKRFKHHTVQASQFLQKLAKESVDLFVHWRIAVAGTFA